MLTYSTAFSFILLTFFARQLIADDVECEFRVGCPNNSSVQGFATLEDLNCFMLLEAVSVIYATPIRQPPYLYLLCPNTVYHVTQYNTINPILTDSWISCGNDGSPDNHCTLVGGPAHVVFTDNPDDIHHDFLYAAFFGITFRGDNSMYSVFATAKEGVVAEFFECQWQQTNNHDFTVLFVGNPISTNNSLEVIFEPAMSISIFGGVVSEGTGLGIVVVNGAITLTKSTIQGGTFVTAVQQSKVQITKTLLQNSVATLQNPFAEAMIFLSRNSSLAIYNSTFISLTYNGPLIQAINESDVTINGCRFVDNLIQGSFLSAWGMSELVVIDTCFINSTNSTPVTLDVDSELIRFYNVFTDGFRDCAIFFQNSQDCWDGDCDGTCFPANTETCSLPSGAGIPSPFLQTDSSRPTPAPTSSGTAQNHNFSVIVWVSFGIVAILY